MGKYETHISRLEAAREDECLRFCAGHAIPGDVSLADILVAMDSLRKTAALLQQNSEGCAVNHYGSDFEQQGMPGWLADSATVIETAALLLAKFKKED